MTPFREGALQMMLRTGSACISMIAVVLVAAMILSTSAVAQGAGVLNGTLVDPQGAAISKAEISLCWSHTDNDMKWNGVGAEKQKPPHKRLLRIVTDSAGRYSVKLPPGNWDIYAYRDGFAPTCAIALVELGKTTIVNLQFSRYAAMSVQ
jgi:hypothetical protein